MSKWIDWDKGPAKPLARIRKAVQKYNAAITRMEKSGLYDAVPKRTSVEQEINYIDTYDQLRQRERELGRILVKNNPKALDIVEFGDMRVPRYMKDEIKNAVRVINQERKERRLRLLQKLIIKNEYGYVDVSTGELIIETPLSPVEEATFYSDKNLNELNEDNYTSPQDLEDLWETQYASMHNLVNHYKDAWLEYNGNPLVIEVIEWMAKNYPAELKDIFDSNDDEVTINYIYPETKSYDKTPMIIRHNRILTYWNDVYHIYAGTDHPNMTWS